MGKIYIGTSGFSYSHWEEGVFYPKNLPASKKLEYYSKIFNTVELNSPFYRLPSSQNFINWRKRTPENFLFAIKVSRYITHIKKLKNSKKEWEEFFKRAKFLKEKLGPFLFQLPPGWKKDSQRLKKFLDFLEKNYPNNLFAFEFRHQSWFEKEIFTLFKRRKNFTFCIADSPKWPSIKKLIGGFFYIRFHGRKTLYGSKYSKKELNSWAKFIKKYLKEGIDVFCYFNNDAYGFAPKDALSLRKLLEK